ncbi:unnamed protein product [Urochloa decumbens]|uniref:Uncharacterized protein n=1 Tax=Urochloa decumbens TaxID=240449 RepID=A0ABC8W183_9POAL
MAIQIGEERSMFHESAARVRTTPSTRIGATSRFLLQEPIGGALSAMDLYIPDEHQVGDIYGTSPYPLIAADDIHVGGEKYGPQEGKIPQQDVTKFGRAGGDLRYCDAICGNHALMGNTITSENTPVISDMAASSAYGEEGAVTYNKRGQWTLNEDSLLKKLVKKIGKKKWSKIAEDLPGRIGKQCRERWFNHLSPNIKKTPWTEKEEKVLVSLHRKHGKKWAKMAKQIPGRPENSIKNNWNATLRWLRAANRRNGTAGTAVRKGSHSRVLENYMRELGLDKVEEAAPAPAAAADPPPVVLDAVYASWQADNHPAEAAVTEPPPSGSNSSPDEECWLPMLCGGVLPPPVMESPAGVNAESSVYATYDADGYVRYVHVQPTPGHDNVHVTHAAAAAEAAEYYNPLPPFPYHPFAHTTYPAGSYYEEAGPSHRYINSGAGEANGSAGFDPVASGMAGGMPFSANNAPAAQNQRGDSAI